MRHVVAVLMLALVGVAVVVGGQAAQPRRDAAPMTIEKVKDGLYLWRGPFNRVPKPNVFEQLKLQDLGWDHTVSTVAFKGGLSGYYDEMKAQLSK
jgi:hypothetical protein